MEWPSDRTLPGSLGHEIYCRYYKPKGGKKSRAMVLILHGFAEYCGTDIDLIEGLVNAGFFVFGHDHIGHGKSQGPRGQIADFNAYIKDTIMHAEKLRDNFPHLPFFILGHSMGGAIAILAALEKPQLWQGMVLIGPMIMGSPETATPTKRFLAKVLAKIVPQIGLVAVNNDHLTKDLEVVKRFNTDPDIFRGKLTMGTAYALMNASDLIIANVDRITWPFLCIHGGDDKICDYKGAELLLERSPSSDKTVSIYPGAYHRVHNEPDEVGSRCIKAIVDWISDRIPPSSHREVEI